MRKNLLLIAVILFTFTRGFAQVTVDEIKEDYKKNPQRAISEYINKAVVTMRVKVNGVMRTSSINKLYDNIVFVDCKDRRSSFSVSAWDVNLEDALKLNAGDSIVVQGTLSGRGEAANSTNWDGKDVLLRKAKILQVIGADSKLIDDAKYKYDCPDCTTDLKKFHDYVVEIVANHIRAQKEYIDKPLTITITVKEFRKASVGRNDAGFVGYAYDGPYRNKITVVGMDPKDQNKINIGDEIVVKGNLIAPMVGMSEEEMHSNAWLKCMKLVSTHTGHTKHCMRSVSEKRDGVNTSKTVNCPCILKQEPCNCYITENGASVCVGKKHLVYTVVAVSNVDSMHVLTFPTDTIEEYFYQAGKMGAYQYLIIHRNGAVGFKEIQYDLDGAITKQWQPGVSPMPNVARLARGDENPGIKTMKSYFYTGYTMKEDLYIDDKWVRPESIVDDFTAPIVEK